VTETRPGPATSAREFQVAASLFVLSGACGLAYQVVWVKLLALQFGSSAWSISTVLAAFMAGLGLGSWWAGRRADKIGRPFLVYGLLELGIALFGLISIPVLDRLDLLVAPLYLMLQGHFAVFVLIRFLLSFVLLIGPTVLMGASLPVLVVGLARRGNFQQTVGLLYGFNTLGAALGVIVTGFVLLPLIGLAGTIGVSVGVGFLVVAIALAWDYQAGRADSEPATETEPASSPPLEVLPAAPTGKVGGLHIALMIAGALGIYYEIIWTRLLASIVGSSTYAFSIILTTFLLGIAIGGLLAGGPLAPSRGRRVWLGLLMAFSSLTVVAGLFLINSLPEMFLGIARNSQGRLWYLFLSQGVVSGSLVILPTIAMGVTLPLAIATYRAETGASGEAVGGLYAANTMGGILGSVLAGFICLPWLGVQQSIVAGGVLGLLVAVGLVLSERSVALGRRLLLGAGLVGMLGLLVGVTPKLDQHHLQFGIFRKILKTKKVIEEGPDLLFIRDGTSSTVSIFRDDATTFLKVNGKTDASSRDDLPTQYLLGHLPLLLCQSPKKVCVIGYGSGATVRAVAAYPVTQIDVVELEQVVIDTSHYFRAINDDVLDDKRVALHLEDGRSFLRYRRTMYDVIISEPSNPWVVGVSALFTTEYYQMVKARLAPGGRFCQWIQSYEISSGTLRVMLSTLAEVFPHLQLFRLEGDLICVAANGPIRADPARLARGFKLPAVRQTLERIRIRNPYELFMSYNATFPAAREQFASDIRNRDGNLWLEYRAPIEMYRGTTGAEIKVISADKMLEGYGRYFFPGSNRDELAIQIASSVARLAPEQHRWIVDLLPLVKRHSARMRIRQLIEQAEKRWMLIKLNPSRIAQALKQLKEEGLAHNVVQKMQAVLVGEPRNFKALRLLAEAEIQLKRHTSAVRHLRAAIALYPLDFIAQTHLGLLLDDPEILDRALEINPTYLPANRRRIAQLRAAGKVAAAEVLQERARQCMPWKRYRDLIASLGEH